MVVLLVAQLLPESHRCTLYWEQQHPLLGKDRICHLFVFVVYISYVRHVSLFWGLFNTFYDE